MKLAFIILDVASTIFKEIQKLVIHQNLNLKEYPDIFKCGQK